MIGKRTALWIKRLVQNASSRLTRQIALAAFVVVVMVGALSLVPLYHFQYQTQVNSLIQDAEDLVLASLVPYRQAVDNGEYDGMLNVAETLRQTPHFTGGALSTFNGETIARFGEPMYHSATELNRPRADKSGHAIEARFGPDTTGVPLQISVRIDTSGVASLVARIMWQHLLVFAAVAFLSTAGLCLILGYMLTGPLLSMRASLTAAKQDPTNAAEFAPHVNRAGLLGDLSDGIKLLLQQLSQTHREELATFAGMVKQAGDGIFAHDSDGFLVYANQSILTLCNVTSLHEMRKLDGPYFVLDGDDTPLTLEQLVENGSYTGEVGVVINEKRTCECLISAAVINAVDGRVLRTYASLSDITAIREAQWAVEEKNRELEEANRIKSEFLAQMSHELRTPLNAIIGFSEILTNRPENDEDDEVEVFAKDINNSGHHLLGVINNILDLSKMEAGKQELAETNVDIAELAESALVMVRKLAASRGVALTSALPDPGVALRCDPVRMKQVLLNLLSNAIKFTDADGSVSLQVEQVDEGLTFTVRDTGIGMNPEDIPNALKPFAQVDTGISRKYEGTGLGLPITAGLIELHGGKMEITSAKGEGTTVSFTLPLERLQAQAA